MVELTLDVLTGELAVVRLPPGGDLPGWLDWSGPPLVSATRTRDETSVICPSLIVPDGLTAERGWRAIKVRGVLDFSLTGILADLATSLARAGVSVFAVSTFDTDYLLVKEGSLDAAVLALQARHSVAGHGAATP